MDEKTVDNNLNLRTGFGVGLLILGIVGVFMIAIMLISLVYNLVEFPEEAPFISKLAEIASDVGPVKVGEEDIHLPYGVYYILGIFIYLIILGIGAGLAKVCIDGGVNLLHEKMDRMFSRLNKEIKKIKKSFSTKKEE